MITVGADLAEAVITAVILERAARYQLLAETANPDFSFSSDAEAISKRGQHFTRGNIEDAWRTCCAGWRKTGPLSRGPLTFVRIGVTPIRAAARRQAGLPVRRHPCLTSASATDDGTRSHLDNSDATAGLARREHRGDIIVRLTRTNWPALGP
jgi:hypothetical protein